jgi:hypothetical protein
MSGEREEGPAFRALDIVGIAVLALILVAIGVHLGLV